MVPFHLTHDEALNLRPRCRSLRNASA